MIIYSNIPMLDKHNVILSEDRTLTVLVSMIMLHIICMNMIIPAASTHLA